jgi:organic hydroperoxide reductase OsmC/OhrA
VWRIGKRRFSEHSSDPLTGKTTMINAIDTVLYTGKTHTTGGRDGQARSTDERLDIRLSPPGSSGAGTNPEQLLAAGWSACFIGAMGKASVALNVALPNDVAVDAEIDLGKSECQPAGPGPDHRTQGGGNGASDLPVLQSDPRQHRRRNQSGLTDAEKPGLTS